MQSFLSFANQIKVNHRLDNETAINSHSVRKPDQDQTDKMLKILYKTRFLYSKIANQQFPHKKKVYNKESDLNPKKTT